MTGTVSVDQVLRALENMRRGEGIRPYRVRREAADLLQVPAVQKRLGDATGPALDAANLVVQMIACLLRSDVYEDLTPRMRRYLQILLNIQGKYGETLEERKAAIEVDSMLQIAPSNFTRHSLYRNSLPQLAHVIVNLEDWPCKPGGGRRPVPRSDSPTDPLLLETEARFKQALLALRGLNPLHSDRQFQTVVKELVEEVFPRGIALVKFGSPRDRLQYLFEQLSYVYYDEWVSEHAETWELLLLDRPIAAGMMANLLTFPRSALDSLMSRWLQNQFGRPSDTSRLLPRVRESALVPPSETPSYDVAHQHTIDVLARVAVDLEINDQWEPMVLARRTSDKLTWTRATNGSVSARFE